MAAGPESSEAKSPSSRGKPGNGENSGLKECCEGAERLSTRQYSGDYDNGTAEFLANPTGMDRFISQAVSLRDAEQAKQRSKKINFPFDKWDVWCRSKEAEEKTGRWTKAPESLIFCAGERMDFPWPKGMDADFPQLGAGRNSLDRAIAVGKISTQREGKESAVTFDRPRACL